jgi:transcriptional regulator with XRE-family HTH domain
MTAREPEMDVATANGSPMGTQIRKVRTAQGMTLRELARRINVTPSFVSQLERNKVNASVGTLYNLVNALGSASCPEDEMMRHGGREYGYVLSGRLDVQVGFDTHVLEPGDAITFDSMTPHRLSNPSEESCQAIWFVVARRSDDRSTELVEPSSNVTHLPSIHP